MAACAAYCSYCVSKAQFNFQKNLTLNQQTLSEITFTVAKLKTLKSLMIEAPLKISDERFNSIEPLFREIKADMQNYHDHSLVDLNKLTIKHVNGMGDMVDRIVKDHLYIDEAINALERVRISLLQQP